MTSALTSGRRQARDQRGDDPLQGLQLTVNNELLLRNPPRAVRRNHKNVYRPANGLLPSLETQSFDGAANSVHSEINRVLQSEEFEGHPE